MSPLARLFRRDDLWSGGGDDVIALHGPDGRFQRVSDSAADLFGRPAGGLKDLRLTDVVDPQDHAALLAALGAVSEEGRGRLTCRIAGGKDGGRPVEITLSRTRHGLRSVTRDVSAHSLKDAALKAESLDAAWFADRRNENLVNVSHEIRTPLGAVIGFADALRRESLGPMGNERYRDYARVIHDSGQHLLGLVSDLLDLSKAEANEVKVEPEPTDLAALVEVCADIVRLQAEEAGLTLETRCEKDLPTVMLDQKLVRQIVLNLLSNALKFTSEGGVTASVEAKDDTLVVSVKDTGVGMSPDDLALVGKRFHQARREGVRGARGTGIGLALSRALARVQNGDLRLESQEGAGTTAVLTLPLERAPDRLRAGESGAVVTLHPDKAACRV